MNFTGLNGVQRSEDGKLQEAEIIEASLGCYRVLWIVQWADTVFLNGMILWMAPPWLKHVEAQRK